MVRAVEGDDPRLAGVEERGAQRDLDRVRAGDAELGRTAESLTKPDRDLRLGQVAEGVRHRLLRQGGADLRIRVAERGDAEPAGKVEVLAPVLVPDPAAVGPGPDHRPFTPKRSARM